MTTAMLLLAAMTPADLFGRPVIWSGTEQPRSLVRDAEISQRKMIEFSAAMLSGNDYAIVRVTLAIDLPDGTVQLIPAVVNRLPGGRYQASWPAAGVMWPSGCKAWIETVGTKPGGLKDSHRLRVKLE